MIYTQLVLERKVQFVVPKEVQVSQFMPSNRINFQPLGHGNPDALLTDAINRANPEFKKRNGDYKAFIQKLRVLRKNLGNDGRLKKLKEKASRRLSELGFSKKDHYMISDGLGKLLEAFYERHIRALPECFQVKNYSLIVDSAITLALEIHHPEGLDVFDVQVLGYAPS